MIDKAAKVERRMSITGSNHGADESGHPGICAAPGGGSLTQGWWASGATGSPRILPQ